MSAIEWLASALLLINLALIMVRSIWNYPFALAAVTLFAFIFWDAKLYSDAGLQVFFFAVNIYGGWSWYRNRADAGQVIVERLDGWSRAAWILASILAISLWGSFMSAKTDASYPYWDASIAMLSIIGQILMTRRYIENWHWWIVVNAISVPLYLAKGLYPTAAVYAVSLAMAIGGLIAWRKAEVLQHT